jgi:hypothetical protein
MNNPKGGSVKAGDGPINPSLYTLMHITGDSLCLEIRNVALTNARIVFVPPKSDAPAPSVPKFALEQNYPNPFNTSTTLRFNIAERSDVKIEIYDVKGTLIRTLVNENLDAGGYPVVWDGTDAKGNVMSSGTYICKMSAGNFNQTLKMTLNK